MELLNGKIKPIYFKYLSASFGTALIASVYSIVDVAMVGQYQGPEGIAALAVAKYGGPGFTPDKLRPYLERGVHEVDCWWASAAACCSAPGVAAAAGTAAKTSILPQRPSAR